MIKRLTQSDIERVKELSKTLTQRQIAERTGLKPCSVSNAIHRPLKGMASKWTLEHAKEWRMLLRLRTDKNKPVWTMKDLAIKYNTTANVIQRKLDEYGI